MQAEIYSALETIATDFIEWITKGNMVSLRWQPYALKNFAMSSFSQRKIRPLLNSVTLISLASINLACVAGSDCYDCIA